MERLNKLRPMMILVLFSQIFFACSNDHEEEFIADNYNEEEADEVINEEVVETAFYVTVNGSATNSGTSEDDAWNIEHAFANAQAGDVVYIKAGDYGNKILNVANQGTAESPIRFIGYTNTPGDVKAREGSTYVYGTSLDKDQLPTLTGESVNEEGKGIAVSIKKDYVEVANIQITTYEKGIISQGDYNKLDNIIVSKVGDFNPAHSYPSATNNSLLNYKGIGIALSGDHSELHNSIVVNAGAEALKIDGGTNQTHTFNSAYADNNVNPTDYYYLTTNAANNNSVSNSYIERVGNLEHRGHGLVLKVEAFENSYYNNTIKNTNVELSFSGVKNNHMENINIVGGAGNRGFFLIANGANNNFFKGCTVENASGVAFTDWKDGYDHPLDIANAGFENTFQDCTFKNGKTGIDFGSWANTGAAAHDNKFINCTFYNMNILSKVDRPNHDNKFIDCKIEKVNNYWTSANGNQLNLIYEGNNEFIDNGFNAPN